MKARYWGGLAILLASVLTVFSARADPQLPIRTGAVVDAADIIRPNQEQALAAKAESLKSQSNVELVVVTLPSLQGYSIERWGRDLGNGWRVGGGTARGVLLIVAPNDREMRIEVGDGLASTLSDRQASSIIDNVIVPQFRSGEMSGGILAGADAIANAVTRSSDAAATASPIRAYFKDLDWSTIQTWGFWGVMVVLAGYRIVRWAIQHPDEFWASLSQGPDDDQDRSGGSSRSSRSGFFSSSRSSSRSFSSSRSSRSFSGRGSSGRW
jgi:uncharacterized protein